MNILSFFATIHAEFIHAHGKLATNLLAQELTCQPKENILEIGIGTGSSIVSLSHAHKKTNFYGIDTDINMHQYALKRVRFCGLKNRIKVLLSNSSLQLPFEPAFFDKVYVESVLAIQEKDDVKLLLTEIARVLKKNGQLIFNESIWEDHITQIQAEGINKQAKLAFGIIQANAKYTHLSDWVNLLNTCGFDVLKTIKLDSIETQTMKQAKLPTPLLSHIFTRLGNLKLLLNSSNRREMARLKKASQIITTKQQKMLEGILFVSTLRN